MLGKIYGKLYFFNLSNLAELNLQTVFPVDFVNIWL